MRERKPIKIVILNPEKLSKNLTNSICDLYEKMIEEGKPMPWENKTNK